MSNAGGKRSVWRTNFNQAVRVMLSHRMRSGLVILGVSIGITTILMMVTALSGLARKINADMVSASRPYVYVQRFDLFVSSEEQRKQQSRKELTMADAMALPELCPSVDRVCFMVQSSRSYLVRANGKRTPPVPVLGASAEFPRVYTFALDHGRYYTEAEAMRRDRVVVLGYGPAQDLFGERDPVGEFVRVAGRRYRVVGTFATRGHILGALSDNFLAMPHTTYDKDLRNENDLESISANVRGGATLAQAEEEITRALRVRRRVPPGEKNDFAVSTSEAFVDLVRKVTVPIGIVLTIIASIGLVVGGIGVMNIMLISVTERTREIGVRMALGAHKSHIMQQFLVEAGMLTGVGGLVGAVFGTLAAWGVSRMIHFPFTVSVFWTVTSILFSVFVGVAFGIYPARRAAAMDPVEALRYE